MPSVPVRSAVSTISAATAGTKPALISELARPRPFRIDSSKSSNSLRYKSVAHRVARQLQAFQQRHAAFDHQPQQAERAADVKRPRDVAQDRRVEHRGVPLPAARLHVSRHDQPDDRRQCTSGTQINTCFRSTSDIATTTCVITGKLTSNWPKMSTNFGNTNVTRPITTSDDTPDSSNGIRQQRADRRPHANFRALKLRQPAEHFRQLAGRFARRHAGHVRIAEHGRLRLHRIGNAFAARHVLMNLRQDVPQRRIAALLRQRIETPRPDRRPTAS